MAVQNGDEPDRQRLQVLTALVVGGLITVVGLLGFVRVPDEGQLLGVFGVNTLHNAVHLVTGLGGLLTGVYAAGRFSDEYNKYGGLAYFGLGLAWFVVPAVLADLLNNGFADTVLHLGLGVVLAGVGFGIAMRNR